MTKDQLQRENKMLRETLGKIILVVTALDKKVEFLITYLNVRDTIQGQTPPTDPNS